MATGITIIPKRKLAQGETESVLLTQALSYVNEVVQSQFSNLANVDLPAHAASTTAHGATGANVGTTNTQTLTNKTLDSSVAKGTWTASGTWTIPAVKLGGDVTLNAKSLLGQWILSDTINYAAFRNLYVSILTNGVDTTVNTYPHSVILLMERNSAICALYYLRGGINATVELLDSSESFTVTKDNAGTINIYYDSGYKIQNKTAGTIALVIIVFQCT